MTRASAYVGVIMLVAVVLVVLVTAGSHAATAPPTPHPTPTPTPEAFDQTTGILAHVALWAWLAALAIFPFAVYVAVVLIGRHRSKLPTEDWRIPYRAPEFPRVLDAHVRTSHPPVPQTLTFAPHFRNDRLLAEENEAIAALPTLGGIDELLSHGRGLAYGWRVDNGELLVDRQVRSLLVGGVQGSGKTSFVALLVAQLVRMNARVMLADPDALNSQGLAYRLTELGIQPEQTAHEPAGMLRLVLNAQHELMNRKDHADARPYVVAVDELPECLRVLNRHDSERLQSALELIGGLKGRKYGVSVIMLGQSWAKAVVGSTAMRNLITSSAVFRMRGDEAKYMTNLRADYWRTAGPDPFDLEPGMFYAVGIDSGAVLARVPKLPDATRAPARESHFEPLPGHFAATSSAYPASIPEAATSADGSGYFDPEEAAREAAILNLARRATPVSEIVRQVYGVRGGQAFQRACQEVMAVISRALKEGD